MKKLLLFFLMILVLTPLFGQRRWNAKGIEVSTGFSFAENHLLATDGSGGAIVAWMGKGWQGYGMYAQRLNGKGKKLWHEEGAGVYTKKPAGTKFLMVADGQGGAIFAWQDARMGDENIYAQRVSAYGKRLWGALGAAVCTENHGQISPRLVSDGTGGAILAWNDFRFSSAGDIFAQRLDAAGNPRWTADGVAVCTSDNGSQSLALIPDGAGGAICVWDDNRSGADGNVFAQRLDASGDPRWTADGVAVCADPALQSNPKAVSDGAGGGIIVWSDMRNGSVELYAQRIDPSGNVAWTVNGVPVASRSNDQFDAAISEDGAGGAVIAWRESLFSGSTYHDLYAQRLDASGEPVWTDMGVPICTAAEDQFDLALAADPLGGAVISWTDGRETGPAIKVYACKLDALGAPLWGENGMRISTKSIDQGQSKLVGDGLGGAVCVWRNGDGSVYSQRLSPLYDVVFSVAEGGRIDGDLAQRVFAGANCTAVEALAKAGYRFRFWSGTGGYYSTANPLRVKGVIEEMSIQAKFEKKTTTTGSELP